MNYEVELKFHLPNREGVLQHLQTMSVVPGAIQKQSDQYFNHPSRDFGQTDEALRIRSIGDENRVTYKGPVVDKATKTRYESELAFQSGIAAAEQLAEIWQQLGFRRVKVVRKSRQSFALQWKDRDIELCLDEVEGLGSFLEIETLATDQDKSAAQAAILSLAQQLNLGAPERRSYLEMLLAQDTATGQA